MKPEHQKIHLRFKLYGANAREWMRKCVLLLPEIERHRIWEQKGLGSIYEYAAKLAGMGHDTVNDGLRILKKTENMPEIRRVIELKGIGAVKPIENLLTKENAAFWAEKALAMSKHTLEIYVRELRKRELMGRVGGASHGEMSGGGVMENGGASTGGFQRDELCNVDLFGRPGTLENGDKCHQQAVLNFDFNGRGRADIGQTSSVGGGVECETFTNKKIVGMELEPEVIEQLEKLKGQGDWNALMKQFLEMRAEQLEQRKPEAVETESRHIPAKIQRYVFARTNGTCSYPGCVKPMKIKHHTQRFALEKVHDSERLHCLCKEHERIAHFGLIENEEKLPRDWKIKTAPDCNAPKYKIDELVAKYRAV